MTHFKSIGLNNDGDRSYKASLTSSPPESSSKSAVHVNGVWVAGSLLKDLRGQPLKPPVGFARATLDARIAANKEREAAKRLLDSATARPAKKGRGAAAAAGAADAAASDAAPAADSAAASPAASGARRGHGHAGSAAATAAVAATTADVAAAAPAAAAVVPLLFRPRRK